MASRRGNQEASVNVIQAATNRMTGPGRLRLTPRARISWLAHLFKACVRRYYRFLTPVLKPLIPEDGVVIDAGGHAGHFTKLFARLARRGRVYTVEPGTYALSILRTAVPFNRLGNVTVFGVGLGDAPGEMTLSVPVKPSGSYGFGLAHMGAAGDEEGGRRLVSHKVEVTTLDRLVESLKLDRLDFMKVDIEGWELRMLVGGASTLERFRPSLMIEVKRSALARAGDTPEALIAHLAALDYRPFVLTPDRQHLTPVAGSGDNDYFFVQKEIAARLPVV